MISHEWIVDGETITFDPSGDVWFRSESVVGMGMPEFFEFTRDAALQDGQTFNGWKLRPRDVLWPVVIDPGPYWMAVQRAFWSHMRPWVAGVWRVTESSTGEYRDLTVRFVGDGGSSYSRDPSIDEVELHALSFVADDPWWHGPVVSKTMQTPETPQPFFEPGPTHVLNIMSANTVASASLENPGDVAAWPTIRIDGPSTGFSFTDTDLDLTLVAGSVTVDSGEWLIIDLTPTEQTALLFTAPGVFTDVTDQLTQFNPRPVQAGTTTDYDVELNGAGSMTVSFEPRHFRAF